MTVMERSLSYICTYFIFLNLFFIEVKLNYNVVLITAVQQSDSVIHIYTFFFHYGLSQDTEYSSLCYRVGPCCLSILYVIADRKSVV